MKIEDDNVIFSSGRVRNANCGIIGINNNLEEVYEGYDGSIFTNYEASYQ